LAKAKYKPPRSGLGRSYLRCAAVTDQRVVCRLPVSVSDFDQLDLEDECGPGRDAWGPALDAVAKPVRDDECTLVADTHVEEGLVPAFDDLAEADAEVKRDTTAPIGGLFARSVENGAIEQAAFVVDENFVADVGRGAFSSGARHVHEARFLGVFSGELGVDEQSVLGTEFELAGAFEGLAHRAIDGSARIAAREDSGAHDDGDGEEREPEEDWD